jgi:hypothetical protein
MNDPPRRAPQVAAGWGDLTAELDLWGEAGRRATLWWRDDDAVTATPQLTDLLRLAGPVPLALAVIPAFAGSQLAIALTDQPQIVVLQHGWQHVNRAGNGKKSEYPPERPAAIVAAEIDAGWARLQALFGPRALPVFVPPWNRFANEFLPILAKLGIARLSGMASRPRAELPFPLAALDVHLDLVAWRDTCGFIGEAAALAVLVGLLQTNRCAADAGDRPIGILTHHLIIDPATAAFVARLISVTSTHRAAHWAAVADLI